MKNSKITSNFNSLGDAQLESFALGVTAAMNGNKNFPEPSPALADLDNGIQLYSNALALSKNRDKVNVARKNQLRNNLQLLLKDLAVYCSFTAKGDRAILSSSGFTLTAESRLSRTLAAPENFTVQNGTNSGEALVYINPVRNAIAYLFLYGPSPISNNAWCHATGSKPYFTITGLVPGTIYSFRIGITGTKGQVQYTDVITKMIA